MDRPSITKIKEYLQCDSFCPWCGLDEIEFSDSIESDTAIAWRIVTCKSCGKEWQNEYKLVAISWREYPTEDRTEYPERIYSDEDMGIKAAV